MLCFSGADLCSRSPSRKGLNLPRGHLEPIPHTLDNSKTCGCPQRIPHNCDFIRSLHTPMGDLRAARGGMGLCSVPTHSEGGLCSMDSRRWGVLRSSHSCQVGGLCSVLTQFEYSYCYVWLLSGPTTHRWRKPSSFPFGRGLVRVEHNVLAGSTSGVQQHGVRPDTNAAATTVTMASRSTVHGQVSCCTSNNALLLADDHINARKHYAVLAGYAVRAYSAAVGREPQCVNSRKACAVRVHSLPNRRAEKVRLNVLSCSSCAAHKLARIATHTTICAQPEDMRA